MSNIKKPVNINKVVTVLDVLLKIGYYFFWLASILIFFMLCIYNFSTHEFIKQIGMLNEIQLIFEEINIYINPDYININEAVTIETLLGIGIFIGSCTCILCIKQIRCILNNIISKNPFSNTTTRYIKNLGFIIMIGGSLVSSTSTIVNYILINLLSLENRLLNTDIITGIHLNKNYFDLSSIVLGIILLVFAKAFEYGKYLQEEYDTTL